MSGDKLKLTASAPILLVRDVKAAAAHYRDAMGFSIGNIYGEPPDIAMLNRDGLHLMLKLARDPKDIIPHWKVADGIWNVYFWCNDADALYADFVSRGAKIDYHLCDKPYGCREFGVQDIDGHDIGFGQVVE